MSKYIQTQSDIFGIFAEQAWKDEAIATYPANFTPAQNDKEYIRLSIISGGAGINALSVEGIVMIDIFTEAGYGDTRALEIADVLDQYLVNKTFSSGGRTTQIFESNLVPASNSEDETLSRKIFSIPFKHFGVN